MIVYTRDFSTGKIVSRRSYCLNPYDAIVDYILMSQRPIVRRTPRLSYLGKPILVLINNDNG